MLFRVKLAFYHVCKWLGLFRLSRAFTRRGLRILGYHGFETADEGRFRQSIFM
ncbi:polysaccharide deacetylase family protein, partial [bacterium]|nr:polysaccharide deacetylase family protein [bacterium]